MAQKSCSGCTNSNVWTFIPDPNTSAWVSFSPGKCVMSCDNDYPQMKCVTTDADPLELILMATSTASLDAMLTPALLVGTVGCQTQTPNNGFLLNEIQQGNHP